MFYTLLSFRALILKEIPGEHFPIKAAFVSVPLKKRKKKLWTWVSIILSASFRSITSKEIFRKAILAFNLHIKYVGFILH